MKSKIESVQMMRGIAALSVVICHLGYGTGRFGVDLFFCISGFIMMLVTEKTCDGFLYKRLLRICPLYYLLTIGAFAVGFIAPQLLRSPNTEWDSLLRSFLFIASKEHEPVVGVGWTLCYEMFFYLLFFIAFKISHKNRHIISTAFLAIIVLAGVVLKPENEYLQFYVRPIILEFALGMLAFKILHRIENKNTIQYNTIQYNTIQYNTIQYFYLLLAVALYVSLFFVNLGVDRLFAHGIPTFVFFVLIFKAFQNKKIVSFLVVLGNISYSLYLTHTFVITFFSKMILNIDHKLTFSSIAVSTLAISTAIGVGYLSWYVIENKLTNWIKMKIEGKKN
jgi:peptidoglycan/LPS O-acetylase OafA/YrhL